MQNMSSNAPAFSSNLPPVASGLRKVAIPRLHNAIRGQGTNKDRRRVSRACTACRSHKIKCTGERPHCKHCASTNRDCEYILPRKDKLKIVTTRCHQMAGLLRGLKSSVNAEDHARITDMLNKVEEEISEAQQSTPHSVADTEHSSQGSREFDFTHPHEELDTESLDLLDENLNTNDRARATGFVGKNSEIQWLRAAATAEADRADEEARHKRPQRRGSFAPGSDQVSLFSFWADDENVAVDLCIDPYDLPQPETAELLLRCYMAKVHDSFPILPRKAFEDQFRRCFTAVHNGNAPQLDPMWQAILNLVFAIGAKYSHLVDANWQADERDHLVYQARARTFGLNESTITSHPDLYQIQMLGLLSFYWLSVGQISRAWTIIGMALRSAFSLGFHVRNEDPTATMETREKHVRVWWSLYSLERTLSIVTGRPSIIVDSGCSVPWPIPVPEEQISEEIEGVHRMRMGSVALSSPIDTQAAVDSLRRPTGLGTAHANSGSYFKVAVQLSNITQSILTSLYSAGTMIRSLGEIQQDLAQLGMRLDQWVESLPVEFNYQAQASQFSSRFVRERMLLGFQLCSARMLLTRPCLGSRKQPRREEHDASSTRRIATSCIEAAKTVIDFLPDEPNPLFVYDKGPWWCIVHHMMQAISVFLLGLSTTSSTSKDNVALVHYVKKAVRWLRSMQDSVAARAYRVALRSFEIVARRLSVDISDLWMETPTLIRNRNAQQLTPYIGADGYMSTVGFSMASAHPTMATYAAYDDMMSDGTFTTLDRAPSFNGPYYATR